MHKVAGLKSCVLAIVVALGVLSFNVQSKSPPKDLVGIDWSKARLVTIIMDDYEFVPKRLVLLHDVPTRLHLVNHSGSMHDFTAPHFFKAVDLRSPAVIGASGMGIPVEPHQQKDVDLVPRLQGNFSLLCADHDWAGMTADILVE